MTAWMVLTKLEPYQKAVRSGLASASKPWKPESIPSPKLADPDVVCFVVVSKLGRPQLVAVLHRPEYAGKGFRGETNEVALIDLTAKWFKLKFDDGGGNPGDATTALKAPRVLADADLKLLGVSVSQAAGPEPLPCVATLVNPLPSELDPGQRKQVVEAGVGYDGRKLTFEQRMAPSELDDGSFFGSLVIRRFEGAGAAYDVLTYMGDSGSIFRAGTTKRVGHVIQGGLQCDDPALAKTLEVSLRAAPVAANRKTALKPKAAKASARSSKSPQKRDSVAAGKKVASVKAPAKKAPAKKAPAKKAPAKKAPAKKAPAKKTPARKQ